MTAAMRTSEVNRGGGGVMLIFGRVGVIRIISCELSDSVAFVTLGFSGCRQQISSFNLLWQFVVTCSKNLFNIT